MLLNTTPILNDETTNRIRVPLWRSYDYSPNYPKQPSGQALVLSNTRLWLLDPSGKSTLKHRPGATDHASHTPAWRCWVGFCLGNHEPSRAPKGPIRLVVTYAAWSGDARASESRPHGQLILVRRKFKLRRLSHGWAGQEQKTTGPIGKPPPQRSLDQIR